MNIEDLKPCPICGCGAGINITIERVHARDCFVCAGRIGTCKGIFECGFCDSTINLVGNSVEQVFEKWNDLARK